MDKSLEKKMDFITRNFSDVKQDDVILSDFSVALQKDAVIHGRIYISLNGYYFHSNILGFVTAVSNPWSSVNQIKKDKVALFLPIIIHIYTNEEKHTFSFLQNRDRAYEIIKLVWLNSRSSNPLPSQAIIDKANEIYYQSYVDITAENNINQIESMSSILTETNNISNITHSQSNINTLSNNEKIDTLKVSRSNSKINSKHNSNVNSKNSSNNNSNNNSSNSDLSLDSLKTASSESLNVVINDKNKLEIEKKPIINENIIDNQMELNKNNKINKNTPYNNNEVIECDCSNDDFKLLIQKEFNTDYKTLMDLFFDQNSPIIPLLSGALGLSEYKITYNDSNNENESKNDLKINDIKNNEKHKSNDIHHTKLYDISTDKLIEESEESLENNSNDKLNDKNNDKFNGINNFKINNRIISYIYPMSFPFSPVLTETTVDLSLLPNNKTHHIIKTSSISQNAPYSDAFKVLMHYCFIYTSSSTILLKIYFKIEFIKKITNFIKSMITTRSLTKTEEFVIQQLKLIEEYLCSIPIDNNISPEIIENIIPTIIPITQVPKTSILFKIVNLFRIIISLFVRLISLVDHSLIKSALVVLVLAIFLHTQYRIILLLHESINHSHQMIQRLNELIQISKNNHG